MEKLLKTMMREKLTDFIKQYPQRFTQALKEYFSGIYSARELIKMSRLIGVEAEVRKYMEVLRC